MVRVTAHTGYSEYNQRALLNRWADDLEKPRPRRRTLEVGGPRGAGRRTDGPRQTTGANPAASR